jgi:hypothetical protein
MLLGCVYIYVYVSIYIYMNAIPRFPIAITFAQVKVFPWPPAPRCSPLLRAVHVLHVLPSAGASVRSVTLPWHGNGRWLETWPAWTCIPHSKWLII